MDKRRMRPDLPQMTTLAISVCLLVVSTSALLGSDGREAEESQSARPGMYGLLYSLETSTDGKGRKWLAVRDVRPGGPAHEAGLRPDDLIVAIDGKPVEFKDNVEVLLGLAEFKVGQAVFLSIMRQSDELSVIVVPAPMTDAQFEQWKANLERAKESREEARRAHRSHRP